MRKNGTSFTYTILVHIDSYRICSHSTGTTGGTGAPLHVRVWTNIRRQEAAAKDIIYMRRNGHVQRQLFAPHAFKTHREKRGDEGLAHYLGDEEINLIVYVIWLLVLEVQASKFLLHPTDNFHSSLIYRLLGGRTSLWSQSKDKVSFAATSTEP